MHLKLARGDLRVDGLGVALDDLTRYRNNTFLVQAGKHLLVVDDRLGDAVLVAQVDERHAAVVTDGIHPPRKRDRLA